MGFEGMKESGLDETFRFAEGGLGVVFAELVNKNRLVGTWQVLYQSNAQSTLH